MPAWHGTTRRSPTLAMTPVSVNRAPPGDFWKPDKSRFHAAADRLDTISSPATSSTDSKPTSAVSPTNAAPSYTRLSRSRPVNASTQLSWMATVRGRLGVTLSPTLLYITGGLAVAHFKDSLGFARRSPCRNYVSNKTRAGMDRGWRRRAHVRAQLDRQDRGALRRFRRLDDRSGSGFWHRRDPTARASSIRSSPCAAALNYKW